MTDRPRAIAEPERIDALDGLRGIAILFVVVFHSLFFDVGLLGAPRPEPGGIYARIAGLGWCGVDVFFVLSGFLITGILLRAKGSPHYFRNFYARRALRIFPLYYAMLVLLLFVLERPPATTGEKWSYLLYYQNLRYAFWGEVHFDAARLITWSLAIEEQFYLLWPGVVWLVPRRRLPWVCAAAIVLAISLRFLLLAQGLHTTHFVTPCRIDTLAAGACLCFLPAPPPWVGRLAVAAGVVGLFAVAEAAGATWPELVPMQRYGLLAALLLAVGLLCLARGNGWFAALCRSRVLRSLGKYSYCVYLVHFLVIEQTAKVCAQGLPDAPKQWLAANVPPTLLVMLFTTVCLAVSWALAFASWHSFEKWFLALKRYVPSGGRAA